VAVAVVAVVAAAAVVVAAAEAAGSTPFVKLVSGRRAFWRASRRRLNETFD
jgi:hypothetical protein